MPIYCRSLLFFFALFNLTACTHPDARSQPFDPKMGAVIQTFQQVEQKVKVNNVNQKTYPALVVEVDTAVTQIPTDAPPRVVKLLTDSVAAYKLALRYWQCDHKSVGDTQAACRDDQLEQVIAKFPYIKRNITNRLINRTNPPEYISSVITTRNMLQLLLMQAELNRVDAHLILTQGDFDGVYSSGAL